MSESETPRTDAESWSTEKARDDYDTYEVVYASFARQLERELAAAKADVETYRDSCAWKADSIDRLGEQVVKLQAEVEALRADAADFHMAYRMKCDEETKAQAVGIERLRAALQGVVAVYDQGTTGYLVGDAFNKARAALAKEQP